MKVILTTKAYKQLTQLPQRDFKRAKSKIKIITTDPYVGKLLSGRLKGWYSLRVWPYRIIYQIDSKQRTVWILSIVHRQGVYKS